MSSWQLGDLNFSVRRGNLSEASLPAVALGVSPDWTPAGPGAGAIIQAGGSELVQSLKDQPDGKPGEVLSMEAGELEADKLLLCALNPRSSVSDPDQFIRDCYRSLYRAADNDGMDRLGLQLLGANDFDYGLDRTTKAAVEVLREMRNDLGTLREVRLIVYDAIDFNAVDNFARETFEGQPTDSGPSPEDFT
ncbi:MAG: macro domain-containing protein [bacterium]